MHLVFATQNPGKVLEMTQLLADLPITLQTAREAGVTEDVVEDKETFVGNSEKKARFVAEQTGQWAVADDTGICIEALDGRPGVYSARWAGEGASGDAIIQKTLDELKGVAQGDRGAYFETAVVLIGPNGEKEVFTGRVNGRVAEAPIGTPRPKLPYDQIFIPEGEERTFAQMSDAEKNAMSHRGRAFAKLKAFLEQKLIAGRDQL